MPKSLTAILKLLGLHPRTSSNLKQASKCSVGGSITSTTSLSLTNLLLISNNYETTQIAEVGAHSMVLVLSWIYT